MTDSTVRERIEALRAEANKGLGNLRTFRELFVDLCEIMLADLAAREQADEAGPSNAELHPIYPPSPAPAVGQLGTSREQYDLHGVTDFKPPPAAAGDDGTIEPVCRDCGVVERAHTYDYSHKFISPPAPDVARVERWATMFGDAVHEISTNEKEAVGLLPAPFHRGAKHCRVVRLVELREGEDIWSRSEITLKEKAIVALRQRAEAAEAENRVTRSRREDADHTLQRQGPLEEELASARAELAALRSAGVEGVVREWATGLAGNRHYRIETNASQTEWPIYTRVRVRKVDP